MSHDKKPVSDNTGHYLPEKNELPSIVSNRKSKKEIEEGKDGQFSGGYKKKFKKYQTENNEITTKNKEDEKDSTPANPDDRQKSDEERYILDQKNVDTLNDSQKSDEERCAIGKEKDDTLNGNKKSDETEHYIGKDTTNEGNEFKKMENDTGDFNKMIGFRCSELIGTENQPFTAGKYSEKKDFDVDAAKDLLLLRTLSKNFDKNSYPYKMQKKSEVYMEESSDEPLACDGSHLNNIYQESSPYSPHNSKPLDGDPCIGFGRQAIIDNQDVRSHYNKNFVKLSKSYQNRSRTEAYDFPGETSPLLTNTGNISSIQPINSFSKKITNFRRFDGSSDNQYKSRSMLSNYSRQELLSELRSVASSEAKAICDIPFKKEEMYFNPPEFPEKHPLQYLQEAAEADSLIEPSFSRAKYRRQDETEADPEGEPNFKSFNDFEEDIFKFDLESKLYVCPWSGCDKSFPSLSRIKRHYIIHTDIKPFKCLNHGCDRRFSRKDNMLQHYRVHCPYANQADKNQ